MKWPSAVALVLALGSGVLAPTPARAWTEYLAMDALPEDSGWTPIFDEYAASSSAVSDGILTLTSERFREYRAPASWLGTVDAATGYRIEFRMRILTSDRCYAQREIGLWYHDRTIGTILSIDPDRIYVHYPSGGEPQASLDATQWHTYTIVVQGSHHRVFVDGVLALDYPHPGSGDAAEVLMFGDLGSCGYSQSQWDYVAYDTAPIVPVAPSTWGGLKTLYRAGR